MESSHHIPTQSQNRHQRRKQQTRNLLIQTTLQLILEQGYDSISIQDITDRADLGRAELPLQVAGHYARYEKEKCTYDP